MYLIFLVMKLYPLQKKKKGAGAYCDRLEDFVCKEQTQAVAKILLPDIVGGVEKEGEGEGRM